VRRRRETLLAVAFAAAAAAGFLSVPVPSAAEGVVQSTYTLTADGTQTWTGDTKTATQKYSHVLDLKYRGFLQPVVENEFTMKVEWNSGDDSTGYIKVTPDLTLKYKGSYWNAGVKRGIEESTEPGKTAKYADKAFVEVILSPPRVTLPDLKAKYNVDKDYQKAQSDTVKHAFEVSTSVTPFEWLAIKGDWTRTLTYDRLKEDSDTEDERIAGSVGVRRLIGQNIRVQSEYRVEDSRSATLLTEGGTSNPKRDQNHTWKNALVFRYVPDGTFEVNYDYELKERMLTPKDHDQKRTYKAVLDQKFKILGELGFKGEFDRVETETAHKVGGDTLKTEDSWIGEVKTRPSKFADLSFKTTWKRTVDEAFGASTAPASTTSFQRSVSWNCDLLPFWKPTVSVDRTDTRAWSVAQQREVPSVVTTVYTMNGPLTIAIPVIEIAPTYTVTFTDDKLAETKQNTVIRDFTAKATAALLKTRTWEGRMDHTYARKVDTKEENVVRTDTTNFSLTARDAVPGWNFEVTVGRNATDTSGDDLGVDLTEALTLKADLKRDPFKLAVTYKYDRTLTEGKFDKYSLDMTTGWVSRDWDLSLTGNYKQTMSPVLDKGTTVNLTFTYKL
jgi:hypothetical protein